MTSSPITAWQIDEETMETVADFIFLGSKVSAGGDCSHEIKRCLLLGREAMTNLGGILKSKDITLPTKVHLVKSYGVSSIHVWIWELDYKESWALKTWCFRIVVLEKTLESSLDCKIKPVNPKGNQSWIFIGRTDAEAKAPILWPPDGKNWLIWKDPDTGKDWRQEEKGKTEDGVVGWHHRLNGHEFEQAPGVGDGQGSLACCSPWGCKESDTTEWLNWTEEPGDWVPSLVSLNNLISCYVTFFSDLSEGSVGRCYRSFDFLSNSKTLYSGFNQLWNFINRTSQTQGGFIHENSGIFSRNNGQWK